MTENRRQRKYRQRREAIVEAARKVFERKGYERASIGEIAGEADFAKGSIYYYFDSKAALLDAVIGDEIERIHAIFRAVTGEKADPLARLAHLVAEILSFYERNFALFRVVIAPMGDPELLPAADKTSSLQAGYRGLIEGNRQELVTLIDEARKGNLLTSAMPADEAADLLHGLITAEVHRWNQAGRKGKLGEKASLVMGLFLNGLASPAKSGS